MFSGRKYSVTYQRGYCLDTYLCSVKFLLSIGLVVVIFSQNIFKTIVVLDWKINQALITEKYCENKARPMLQCDGKCYLAKQLSKLDAEEQSERQKHSLPESKLKEIEFNYVLSSFPLTCVSDDAVVDANRSCFAAYCNLYHFDASFTLHPPPDFGYALLAGAIS